MATPKKDRSKRLSTTSRQNKALFLPLNAASVNELSLQFRLALESVRRGYGDQASMNRVASVVLLTSFLTEAGHGELDSAFLAHVEKQVSESLDRGRDSGEWNCSEQLCELLKTVVNEHDRQLRQIRLKDIIAASERLDRMIEKGSPPLASRR
jgi:hypothetical protein